VRTTGNPHRQIKMTVRSGRILAYRPLQLIPQIQHAFRRSLAARVRPFRCREPPAKRRRLPKWVTKCRQWATKCRRNGVRSQLIYTKRSPGTRRGAHRHKTLAAICWTIPRHTATGHRTSASKTETVRCVGLVNKAGVQPRVHPRLHVLLHRRKRIGMQAARVTRQRAAAQHGRPLNTILCYTTRAQRRSANCSYPLSSSRSSGILMLIALDRAPVPRSARVCGSVLMINIRPG